MNKDGWVDIDEYTEILRRFGKDGHDIEAAIQFLFGVYNVKGNIILFLSGKPLKEVKMKANNIGSFLMNLQFR